MADRGAGCVAVDDWAFPWRVAPVGPDRRFQPFGAPGRKRLQRLLIDHRVPRRYRAAVVGLEAGGQLLWVSGLRASEATRSAPGQPVFRLSWSWADGAGTAREREQK